MPSESILVCYRTGEQADTVEALRSATREELQAYLEAHGFAVYASEDIEKLRTAAILHETGEE